MPSIQSEKFTLVVCLWTGMFCNYACYSIIAPFFPQLARKKGLSVQQYSLVFGSHSLSQLIFTCLVGKWITRISAKFLVVSGLFLTGGSTILFGCMEGSRGGTTFFALCFAIRVVEGAGIAAYLTSCLVIIVKTFPTDPGYYVGLTESVITVAMIAGPPLGSFLYTVGGYAVPFVTLGVILIITCAASFRLVPEDREPLTLQLVDSMPRPVAALIRTKGCSKEYGREETVTTAEYLRLVSLPAGILTLFSVTANVTGNSFILVVLSDHLIPFSLTTMQVGFVYLCLFLSYGVSSPLSGYIADKTGLEFMLQGFGSILVAVAFCLIGPVIFFHMKAKLWMIVIGLLLRGVGAGPLIACAFSAALRAAKNSGFPDDFSTYSMVSTLVSVSIPLGNFFGSVTAGVMYENLGMPNSTTIYFGIFLFLAVLCFGGHFIERPPRFTKKCTEKTQLYSGDIKMHSLKSNNIFDITDGRQRRKNNKENNNCGFMYNLETNYGDLYQ